jgi:hypothetical protein
MCRRANARRDRCSVGARLEVAIGTGIRSSCASAAAVIAPPDRVVGDAV